MTTSPPSSMLGGMNIEDAIKAAMARMIRRKEGIEVEVTSWDEEFDVAAYGGCETCGPEYEKEYSVVIWYRYNSRHKCIVYKGRFTDLIKELDNEQS